MPWFKTKLYFSKKLLIAAVLWWCTVHYWHTGYLKLSWAHWFPGNPIFSVFFSVECANVTTERNCGDRQIDFKSEVIRSCRYFPILPQYKVGAQRLQRTESIFLPALQFLQIFRIKICTGFCPCDATDFNLETGLEHSIFHQDYETGTYFLSSCLYS